MNKQILALMFLVSLGCAAATASSNDVVFQNSFETQFLWSDPTTWEGTVPVDGDNVTIPEGKTVILDVDTAALSGLSIEGSLVFDDQDLNLTSDWIIVSGSLHIGSADQAFTQQATLTLTGDDPDVNTTTRGLIIMGGQLELHGISPQTTWSKINQHAQAGDSLLTVVDSQGWNVGDQIVLAPTDYYGVGQSEQLEISAINGNQISLSNPVSDFHWGVMQYATSNGMSLSSDGSIVPPAVEGNTPLELDERAEIGNLTRNIVIQAPNDSAWQNDGLGAHLMIMSLDSIVHVDSVEFRRVGQAGRLARYPFHWHFLSYLPDGTELGDATGQYLRNSSIHDSANRCVTIHGTNGVQVQNNICYDVLGHAIFFEDAVERRNTVEDNLVMRVRFPAPGNALKLHDIDVQSDATGSSGLWVSNPDNTVRNNVFADTQGFGMWLAFPANPVGQGANVPILPFRTAFGNFDGNTVHSNRLRGVMFDNSEIDDLGNVGRLQYASTTDGQNSYANAQRFVIRNWTLWKNGRGNFWDRVTLPSFEEFVSADSSGKFFAGSGFGGIITRTLLVGSSLNDSSARPKPWMGPPTALATYHSEFSLNENIIINFPFADNQTSGAYATEDYYTRGVEKGHIKNFGNMLINSHPGYRSDAAIDENIVFNFAQGLTHFVFAGALWDPYGIWGLAGNWNVYNTPFFTHTANCNTILPVSQNAASCDGSYFGVDQFILDQVNQPYNAYMAISIDRLDNTDLSTIVGNWQVDSAMPTWLLPNMRHFAAHENGIFTLNFPDSNLPVDVAISISNMLTENDAFVLGIEYSGTEAAQVFSSTFPYDHYITDAHAAAGSWVNKHDYTPVASRQQVIDSSGETFWQDTANDRVWVKISYADLIQLTPPDGDEFSELTLYNEFHLRVWSDN